MTPLILALMLWAGLILTTTAVTNAFSGARPLLTLIDAGHWLAVLLAVALVMGPIGS